MNQNIIRLYKKNVNKVEEKKRKKKKNRHV